MTIAYLDAPEIGMTDKERGRRKLAAIIKHAREGEGLTQAHVARALGLSRQQVNDMENSRRSPSAAVTHALAAVLNLPADYLHYLMGRIPPDMFNPTAAPADVIKGLKALRENLEQDQ